MEELNKIIGSFLQVSGSNKLIDKTDVEEGRLSQNIARALGIIDENGNYTDKVYSQEDLNSGGINELFNRVRQQKSKIKKNNTSENKVNENNGKQIFQKKCKVNGREGVLTKFEDGSVKFDASYKNNVYTLEYKNEEDFKLNRPSKLIEGPKLGSRKFTRTTQYEYYENGKLKQEKQTLDENGRILKIGDYDERGGLVSQKKYDKDGNLYESSTGKWEDENTHIIIVSDKDGKNIKKIVDILKEGKIYSRTTYDNNGVKKEENLYTNGKLSNRKVYYPNGELRTEVEFFPEGGMKNIKTFDKNGGVLQNYEADMIPDGKTWDKSAAQIGEGDCYLVASVNSIRKLSDGDKILSDLIDIKTDSNGKKTYTVTLPGAIIASKGLAKDKNIDPNKMYITGTYTFTEEEFNKIAHQQGSKYSIGNANIVLLEAAFEKFREEVLKTVKANNIDPNKNMTIPGLFTTDQGLAGGVAYDAVFMLTGKASKVYSNNNPDFSLEKGALQNGEIRLVSNNKDGMVKAAPSSVNEMTQEKSRLNVMLDEIKNDIKDGKKDIIATVGFRIYNSETGKTTGHALTIVDVTDKTVTITNPWYPDRTLTMSREDFLAAADMVTICDASKESKIREQNINVKPDKKPSKDESKPNPSGHKPNGRRTMTPNQEKQIEKQIKDLVKNWNKQPRQKTDSKSKRKFEQIMKIVSNNKQPTENPSKREENKTQEQLKEKQIIDIYNQLKKK